jgi:hypothetical protein
MDTQRHMHLQLYVLCAHARAPVLLCVCGCACACMVASRAPRVFNCRRLLRSNHGAPGVAGVSLTSHISSNTVRCLELMMPPSPICVGPPRCMRPCVPECMRVRVRRAACARVPVCCARARVCARRSPRVRSRRRESPDASGGDGLHPLRSSDGLLLSRAGLPASLPARLPASLPASLPACLPCLPCLAACLPACLPACPPSCLPASASARLPACLPDCQPARLPTCLSACLPACLPACLTACLPAWARGVGVGAGVGRSPRVHNCHPLPIARLSPAAPQDASRLHDI